MSQSLDRYRAAESALWSRFGASPSEQFFELESGRVRVQEIGAGQPVVFVHGVMTAGSAFAPLVARLPGVRSIVLDRPGCGLSAPWQLHAEFRDQAVDVIRQVLDVLQLDSVALVGNSLGALWSTWFAMAHPARVRKLVLLGPSIGFPGVRAPIFMRIAAIPGIGALIKRKMRTSHASLRRIFVEMGHQKSIDAGKIPAELFEWGVRLDDTGTPRHDFDAVRRAVGITGARRWIQLGEHELKSLSVPTLVLAGTDDSHGGPALAARIAELIPGATVQSLQDAGHVPWLDDASAVAEPLRCFVTEAR
jgi:2-hydroxy-6-oxonona-2,4-dienedioate hydrolase